MWIDEDLAQRLDAVVEQLDGIAPASVESLVGMAVEAFVDGVEQGRTTL